MSANLCGTTLAITFGTTEHGCADAVFDTGKDRVEFRISYCTDPFEDLADLALAMLCPPTQLGMPTNLAWYAHQPSLVRAQRSLVVRMMLAWCGHNVALVRA